MAVYFVGNGNGQVKIGYSQNPKRRLVDLQTASPHKLEILAVVPGGEKVESDFHKKYAWRRMEGEWFQLCDEIELEIKIAKEYHSGYEYQLDDQQRVMWEDAHAELIIETDALRKQYEANVMIIEKEIERLEAEIEKLEAECDAREEELDIRFDEKTKDIYPWWVLDKQATN